ncbi:MAG: hypothetical protein F6K21_32530 [Symploca sp. SIO2D2]|nr:hypothetical protein [Symploca sp. SIO2D2]
MAIANFNGWNEESYTKDQLDPTNRYPHVEASWVIDQGSNSSVTQTETCLPSFFYSDFNTFNKTIEVELAIGDKDDDFLGFALNFQPGDTTNPSPDILLVDWMGKERAERLNRRMQLSQITEQPNFIDFTNLDHIAEAKTLGSTIWERNRVYKFKFICTESNIKVWVDDSLEFDVSGTFTDGRLACYACGQREVTFRNVQVEADGGGSAFGSGNWELVSSTIYQPFDLKSNFYFGCSVAVNGDRAIVGAYGANPYQNYGWSFIYQWDGATWQQQQKLQSEILTNGWGPLLHFGYSVGISGEWAIAGAPACGTPSTGYESNYIGAVYLFKLEGEIWEEKFKIQPEYLRPNDKFGSAVAISGEVFIVGCPYGDSSQANTGTVSIFQLEGDTWQYKALLPSQEPKANDQFGYCVAMSGDTALVSGKADNGSVHVFQSVEGIWSFTQLLEPPNLDGKKNFGCSVAIDGDIAVVGDQEQEDGGIAYIFQLEGETWQFQQSIQPEDLASGDKFGSSVDISGDTVIVGAPMADQTINNQTFKDVGKAYIFKLEGGTWKQKLNLPIFDYLEQNQQLGNSVAISGKLAMAGSWYSNVWQLHQGQLQKVGAVHGFESRDEITK